MTSRPEPGDVVAGIEVVRATTLFVRYRELGKGRIYQVPIGMWWRWTASVSRMRCSRRHQWVQQHIEPVG